MLATMLADFDNQALATLCEDLGVDHHELEGSLAERKISLIGKFIERDPDSLEEAIKRAQAIRDLGSALPSPTGGSIVLFLSYSHEDDKLRKRLQGDLDALGDYVLAWYDGKIKGGKEIGPEIAGYLDKADVILLLVSPDFLRSRYVREIELPRAIERHRAGEARVVPIILRPANWKKEPWDAMFGELKAFPKDGKPVTKWGSRDEAFVDIYEGLLEIIRELHEKVKAVREDDLG